MVRHFSLIEVATFSKDYRNCDFAFGGLFPVAVLLVGLLLRLRSFLLR